MLMQCDALLDLDVAHESPGAGQEMVRVIQNRPEVEPDIHVGSECGDIAEGEVADAGRGLAVMKQFQHIGTARPNLIEPPQCDNA